MNKKTVYVAFSTQKGGAGKTTLTVLVASYLHYVKGYNVAVIDCDYPQYSVVEMRKRDLNMVLKDPYYNGMAKEQFTRLNKKAYPVIAAKPETALDEAAKLCEGGGTYDFIFFDLPGTINNAGVVHTLSAMEYIFTPITADRVVVESSLRFATVLNNTLITTGKSSIRGLYMLWNMVDGREKTELYDVYDGIMAELGLTVLKTVLPDSKRFRKEVSQEHRPQFKSTIFPTDRSLTKGGNVEELTDEILTILNR